MLRAHGTCSTITTLDQSLQNLTPEQRQLCAKVMVRSLYDDVVESVRRDVERRIPGLPPGESLRSLMAGRDWLLESGNYHVDVSHLHAVIRFARSLEAPAEELDLALQLCEYGQRLAEPLQYAGEPPFVDYYPAHAAFFRATSSPTSPMMETSHSLPTCSSIFSRASAGSMRPSISPRNG